jgi:hypothetical protein
MKWNGTLAWICWPMHVRPILTSVLLVIYKFLILISSDDGIFQIQLNFSEELHSYSWFFSWASIKDRTLNYRGIELDFSMKLFNKNNISMPQVSLWAVLFDDVFCLPISLPQLNLISDRKLEKLASSTWSLHAIVLYELFMRFSEWKIWISSWIDSIHREYMLSPRETAYILGSPASIDGLSRGAFQ